MYVNANEGVEDIVLTLAQGFDVSAEDVTIQNSVVKNQDDCIAINSGKNITYVCCPRLVSPV